MVRTDLIEAMKDRLSRCSKEHLEPAILGDDKEDDSTLLINRWKAATIFERDLLKLFHEHYHHE